MANVFFRGVAGRVLRDYVAGGQRWLLVETQAGLRFSWLASETKGSTDPAAHPTGAQTMASPQDDQQWAVQRMVERNNIQATITRRGNQGVVVRCQTAADAQLLRQQLDWLGRSDTRVTGTEVFVPFIRAMAASPVVMAADRNGRALRVGDWVMLEDGQTRVVRAIFGDQIAVENNGNGWVHTVDASRVSYYPVAGTSAQTMAASAEDADGRAVHVGDSVQVSGAPTHPLHKVVAIRDGGWLTLRPAAGGALVEMPAREVVARLFDGGSPSHVTMASAAAQDKNGASLAVGDRVRTPYDEEGIVQRVSTENGRVVVWTDMGQKNQVSRGIVGWNAAGLVKVFSAATTMANEAAKNISLPSGWRWLNGAQAMVFPLESGRYSVTRYMADQSPSTDTEGAFDSITAAIRHADSLLPDHADSVTVWDHKRGYAVATARV